jgi:hypothetical protein
VPEPLSLATGGYFDFDTAADTRKWPERQALARG